MNDPDLLERGAEPVAGDGVHDRRESPADILPRIAPDSLRHSLARALRDAIVRGQMKPGDRLVEREISERTGVSRGPVREAMRQLEQEGLIESVPYTGTRVRGISQSEVDEILVPIRVVLEQFAVRHVLKDLTEEDFQELEQLNEAMRRAAAADDLPGLVEADLAFHVKVVERAGNHCLLVWQSIAPRVRAYFYRDGYRHATLDELPEEHAALLAAMRTRDVEHVVKLLEEHIQEAVVLGHREPGAVHCQRPEPVVGGGGEVDG